VADNRFEEEAARLGDENVAAWNDKPGRTHAEVIAAFDRAIAKQETEQ